MKECLICKRILDNPKDPVRSRDCGGDCLKCMADSGDPDAVRALAEWNIMNTPDEVYVARHCIRLYLTGRSEIQWQTHFVSKADWQWYFW